MFAWMKPRVFITLEVKYRKYLIFLLIYDIFIVRETEKSYQSLGDGPLTPRFKMRKRKKVLRTSNCLTSGSYTATS